MGLGIWFAVAIAGSLGQFVDTLAGMGFGAFSSSIMMAAGLTPALVVATVNLGKIGSGLFSGVSHWKFGNVRWAWVTPLALSGVVGGALGALMIANLPPSMAALWVPAVLLAMGLLLLRRFLFGAVYMPRVAGGSETLASASPLHLLQRAQYFWDSSSSRVRLTAIGFLGGIFNGVSGAYGPFTTTSVLLAQGGHPRYAIGTVNLVEVFVAGSVFVTLLTQMEWGSFRWELSLALLAGSALTAPLGAYLSRHLPARGLGILLGIALIGLNAWSILAKVI